MNGWSISQTVLISGAAGAARRPLVSAGALAACGLVVAVLVLARGAGGLALAWAVVGLLLLLTLVALAGLIVYALQSPDRARRVRWEPVVADVLVTRDAEIIAGRQCVAACTLPATAVFRNLGDQGRLVPLCSIHASAAASFLRRGLPARGGPR